ncbi:MAG: amino acid permease [Candidatus Sumerlaeia bacterium]|nr:amino acid permease [Candidatus Sumerlaeia bacterium]
MAGKLKRELNTGHALLLGLGSIFGTGVFVTIGLSAGLAGSWVIPAIMVAGLLATLNALNSAQLAAAYPVSGGAYEYGHRLLGPNWGFGAGALFLVAKAASAATASLAFAQMILPADMLETRLLALVVLLGVSALVMLGLRRSSRINALMVGGILGVLVLYILAMLPASIFGDGEVTPRTDTRPGGMDFLHATALVFVAYTGYGRLATLGGEIRNPRRTIPRAIIGTLLVTTVVYTLVAIVGVMVVGGAQYGELARESSPLAEIAKSGGAGWLAPLLVLAGAVALLAVILNLILGLSRVALSMGRRGEMPVMLARVHPGTGNPDPATMFVAFLAAAFVMVNSIEGAWTLSAFTVLVYYGINNLAALKLSARQRLYPRWTTWGGIIGCLSLAFAIPPAAMVQGIIMMVIIFLVRLEQKFYRGR